EVFTKRSLVISYSLCWTSQCFSDGLFSKDCPITASSRDFLYSFN
ncbi:CBS domain protein, partial [Chlamydia psittaci 06-1683]